MNLNKCIQCGSPAVEQVRGKMGPGDYKEMQRVNHKGHWVEDSDYFKRVDLYDDIKDDFRVSCSKCDNATGWNKPNAPGMPGVGLEFSRKTWNDRNPTAQKPL